MYILRVMCPHLLHILIPIGCVYMFTHLQTAICVYVYEESCQASQTGYTHTSGCTVVLQTSSYFLAYAIMINAS